MYYRSPSQLRDFNFPVQAGGDNPLNGRAINARIREHTNVKDLDIVMAYSDGYADNVFPSSYTRCLETFMDWTYGEETLTDFSKAADCQAKFAYGLSKQNKYMSPFSTRAWTIKQKKRRGGKQDDISIIIA